MFLELRHLERSKKTISIFLNIILKIVNFHELPAQSTCILATSRNSQDCKNGTFFQENFYPKLHIFLDTRPEVHEHHGPQIGLKCGNVVGSFLHLYLLQSNASSNALYEAFLNRKEDRSKSHQNDLLPLPASFDEGGTNSMESDGSASPQPSAMYEPSGVRPRKPCNCTKSQCLKL